MTRKSTKAKRDAHYAATMDRMLQREEDRVTTDPGTWHEYQIPVQLDLDKEESYVVNDTMLLVWRGHPQVKNGTALVRWGGQHVVYAVPCWKLIEYLLNENALRLPAGSGT